MEGYTNISGNHEDFDDLDIEGRMTLDEWNCNEDSRIKVQYEKKWKKKQESMIIVCNVKLYYVL
jgi:ferredoxin-like protein FixX